MKNWNIDHKMDNLFIIWQSPIRSCFDSKGKIKTIKNIKEINKSFAAQNSFLF